MATGEAIEQELQARDPDVKLMLQVRDEVPGAFETLVERYQDRLIGILAHLIGGTSAEAEDLAQDVFLRVYRARKGYRPRARFSTWLFTIANNVALNHLRGKGRDHSVPFGDSGDSQSLRPSEGSVPSAEGTPSTQMRQAELSQIVREALSTLGEDQRVAVLLNKFEEMSYAEIAEVMGKTEAAVKSLLARARMNLRDRLEPYLRSGSRGP